MKRMMIMVAMAVLTVFCGCTREKELSRQTGHWQVTSVTCDEEGIHMTVKSEFRGTGSSGGVMVVEDEFCHKIAADLPSCVNIFPGGGTSWGDCFELKKEWDLLVLNKK